ncbi:hypothetical protein K1719_016857 [Acacia pycnantha]|nr:hypothetical protein K1719_016857 [Acacia pycnantha]
MPGSKDEVAVKKVSHESRQGMKEFIAEIVSIDRYLHNKSNVTLNWMQRFRIIKGVASGLCYLHEEWEQVVVHRDIKASNVLLDSELNGRLGDFGLARLYDHGSDPATTHVVGTMGYLAPESTRTRIATTKSDVFAFVAFMLEVVCGRRPVDLAGDRPSMRQVVQYLNMEVPLPDFSTLISSPSCSGFVFRSHQDLDDIAMSLPSSNVDGFHSRTSTIHESILSGGR